MDMKLYSNMDEYKKGIYNIIHHKYQELLKYGIIIGMNGLNDGTRIEINDTMIQLFHIIPLITKRCNNFNICSYNGKHRMEKLFTKHYISNGQFQLVMITLGFKYKYRKDSINMSFGAKWIYNEDIGYNVQHPYPFFNSIVEYVNA